MIRIKEKRGDPPRMVVLKDCKPCFQKDNGCIYQVLLEHFPVKGILTRRGWGCPRFWIMPGLRKDLFNPKDSDQSRKVV